MSKLLTKKQILEVEDIKTERVHVEDWDGDVLIKTLTGTERDEFETYMFADTDDDKVLRRKSIRSGLLSRTLVDEEGNKLFEEADIEALGMKSAKAIDTCFEVASRLSKMSEKDVDDMVDFSVPIPDNDSISPSETDSDILDKTS